MRAELQRLQPTPVAPGRGLAMRGRGRVRGVGLRTAAYPAVVRRVLGQRSASRAHRARLTPRGGRLASGDQRSSPNGFAGLVEAPAILASGQITSCDLIPWGSNYTFAVRLVDQAGASCQAIYKPQRGEAPLWDFPMGTLYLRERAAYLVCRLVGWEFIPPTIVRTGPHGIGSVQLYVDADEQRHYFDFKSEYQDELRRIALFDLLTNNADRKAGHCLLGKDGKIWAIDHGLTFNTSPKLRTVIWEFSGETIPDPLTADLRALVADKARLGALQAALCEHLNEAEVAAFFRRLEAVLEAGRYPLLDRYRNAPRPLW